MLLREADSNPRHPGYGPGTLTTAPPRCDGKGGATSAWASKTTIKSRVLQLASEVIPRCGNRLYVKEQEQLAEPA